MDMLGDIGALEDLSSVMEHYKDLIRGSPGREDYKVEYRMIVKVFKCVAKRGRL